MSKGTDYNENIGVRMGVLNDRTAEDKARSTMQLIKRANRLLKVYKVGLDISLNSSAEECMEEIMRAFSQDKIDMAVVELSDLNSWYLKYGRPDSIIVGATLKRRDNRVVLVTRRKFVRKPGMHAESSRNYGKGREAHIYVTSGLIAEQLEQLYESVACTVRDGVPLCIRHLVDGDIEAVAMYAEELVWIPKRLRSKVSVREFDAKHIVPESLSGVSVLLIRNNPHYVDIAHNITDKSTEVCMRVEGMILYQLALVRDDIMVTAYSSVKKDMIRTCVYAASENYAYRMDTTTPVHEYSRLVSKVVDKINENV